MAARHERDAVPTAEPHDRHFEAVAQVEGEEIGRGQGKSKKSAEQSAALAALTGMDND